MQRLLGLLILLYGLLLALNTGLPTVAQLAGDEVLATVRNGECAQPLGEPPLGGVYGTCPAAWPGSVDGQLFGDGVSGISAASAFTYPFMSNYAVLPPSNADQVAAITSALIIVLGIMLLVSERKERQPQSDGDGELASDA